MVSIVVTRRVRPYPPILVSVLAIVIGVLITGLVLLAFGVPIDTYFEAIFEGFTSGEIMRPLVYLILIGTALTIAFRGAMWNIGAEGQMIIGMILAGVVAYLIATSVMVLSGNNAVQFLKSIGVQNPQQLIMLAKSEPQLIGTYYIYGAKGVNAIVVRNLTMSPIAAQLLALFLAAVFGGIWAAIPGSLKSYLGVDEVATTLIMNYVAYYFFNYSASTYLLGYSIQARDFYRTDQLHALLQYPRSGIPGSTITWAEIWIAIVAFVVVAFVLKYTSLGVRVTVLGSNPDALRAAGVNVKRLAVIIMTLSGVVAGIAGAALIFGNLWKLEAIKNVMSPPTQSFGYTGILVSWISMLEIYAVPPAAFILAGLQRTGRNIESILPSAYKQSIGFSGPGVMMLLIGAVLLTYIVLRVISEYSIRIRR